MDKTTLERIVRRSLHRGTTLPVEIRLNGREVEKEVSKMIAELEKDGIIKATYSGGK